MTTTDPVALLSTTERQFDPSEIQAFATTSSPGLVELLWHERQVTQSGQLTRVSIPLAGRAPEARFGPQLAAVLDVRWAGRRDLLSGAKILSVVARVDDAPLATPRLDLSFVTDQDVASSAFDDRRIAAELRRAVRDLQRGYALPSQLAA